MESKLCKYGVDHSTATMCKDCDADQVAAASKIDQPKPAFTLEDLDEKLTSLYNNALRLAKNLPVKNDDISQLCAGLQELTSIVVKHKMDMMPIDVKSLVLQEVVDALKSEKPVFTVCGVQLWIDRRIQGVSLYSTIMKARSIRDICNKEYARLAVNHEAKILSYPVY